MSIENNTFDVKDHGLYITGSSSDATVTDNSFRNGTSSTDSCIYQSGDETGDAIFDSNDFDNCYYAWRSSSNGNIFSDNVLNENNYGVLLSGPEAYNNLLWSNSFDESNIAIYIYNGAFANNLFNNTFEDSDDYDIKLSDSEDTVSFNNSFSSIFVSSDANMWVKIYMSLTLYDNSSETFSNVDLEIMEDGSSVYATEYFDGTDSKTNATGEIETLLLASKKYDGSSIPDLVDINISSRYHDWVKTSTHNINSVNDDISIYVDDFKIAGNHNRSSRKMRIEKLTWNKLIWWVAL